MRPPPPIAVLALVGGLASAASGAFAQPSTAPGDPSLTAARLPADASLLIDGVLDEAAWAAATPIELTFGIEPVEGAPVEAPTTVRVLTDDKHLYFGFDCALASPTDTARAYVAAREDVNRDDQVGIYLDPFGDGRRAYIFYVNAAGVQQDMVVTIDGYWSGAWDALFRSAGHMERGRYTVEVAIPFRSLRFPTGSDLPWRARFTRRFGASQAKAVWPPYRRDAGPMLRQFAALHGVAPRRSGIGLELQPGLILRAGLDRDPATDTMRWRKPGFPQTVDPSLGIKWQISPSMTLDAAINPDFSQIEADPNVIDNNLRFPLFLAERRPFFLEGRELYDDDLLYSRSIVDPLYGIKVSGKIGRVSIATLHALDQTPAPSLLREQETPGFAESDVAGAMALVTHLGSRLDLGERGSLGVTLSDKELVSGLDHRGGYRGGKLDGVLGLDELSTLTGAIAVSDTSRAGGERVGGALLGFGLQRSERFGALELGGSVTTRGYRSENGFLSRADRAQFGGEASTRFEPKTKDVNSASAGFWWGSSLSDLAGAAHPDMAEIGAYSQISLSSVTSVQGWTEAWSTRYLGKRFEGVLTGVELANARFDFLSFEVDAFFGDTLRYSDATKTLARGLQVQVALRAWRRIKLDLGWEFSALGKDWSALDVQQVFFSRLRLGFTRQLSLRLIAQGEIGQDLALSALLAFQPNAGSSIFLGWAQRFEAEGGPLRVASVDLFLKGTFLLRL